MRKPDPAAYEYLLEKLDLPGDAVIYVDDFPVNLPPADALGMRTSCSRASSSAAAGFPHTVFGCVEHRSPVQCMSRARISTTVDAGLLGSALAAPAPASVMAP